MLLNDVGVFLVFCVCCCLVLDVWPLAVVDGCMLLLLCLNKCCLLVCVRVGACLFLFVIVCPCLLMLFIIECCRV